MDGCRCAATPEASECRRSPLEHQDSRALAERRAKQNAATTTLAAAISCAETMDAAGAESSKTSRARLWIYSSASRRKWILHGQEYRFNRATNAALRVEATFYANATEDRHEIVTWGRHALKCVSQFVPAKKTQRSIHRQSIAITVGACQVNKLNNCEKLLSSPFLPRLPPPTGSSHRFSLTGGCVR
jgi:hypothetical protein